ncbi:MAG: hypothetical protein DRH26_17380 [Deltaproteobacteria bacterium]|nr:MAG: hypothetical protein DRH26_17380 [Deltaproteobacteria bacterium]
MGLFELYFEQKVEKEYYSGTMMDRWPQDLYKIFTESFPDIVGAQLNFYWRKLASENNHIL